MFMNECARRSINLAQLTELQVGGKSKKGKVHVFLQTHSWVICECIIPHPPPKKKKSSLLLREGANVMRMSHWSRDQRTTLPGWSTFNLHRPVPTPHEIAGYTSTRIKEVLLARHLWRPSRPNTPFKVELSPRL